MNEAKKQRGARRSFFPKSTGTTVHKFVCPELFRLTALLDLYVLYLLPLPDEDLLFPGKFNLHLFLRPAGKDKGGGR